MLSERHHHLRRKGPVCLKTKSSLQLYKFYIEELKKKAVIQPGRRTIIGGHHPSQHELLTQFECKSFWRKPIFSKLQGSQFL